MSDKLLLIGAGGHARVVLDAAKQSYLPEDIGFIDPGIKAGTRICGIALLGGDEALPALRVAGWNRAHVAIGCVGKGNLHEKAFDMLKSLGFEMQTLIDESALVSDDAVIGEGSFVNKRVVIQPGATLGKNCILNTACVIEHDCVISDHANVASGAILLGAVRVGRGSFIGAGSVVRQGCHIGCGCVIGMGSTVIHDVPDGIVAYGNPARERCER